MICKFTIGEGLKGGVCTTNADHALPAYPFFAIAHVLRWISAIGLVFYGQMWLILGFLFSFRGVAANIIQFQKGEFFHNGKKREKEKKS